MTLTYVDVALIAIPSAFAGAALLVWGRRALKTARLAILEHTADRYAYKCRCLSCAHSWSQHSLTIAQGQSLKPCPVCDRMIAWRARPKRAGLGVEILMRRASENAPNVPSSRNWDALWAVRLQQNP